MIKSHNHKDFIINTIANKLSHSFIENFARLTLTQKKLAEKVVETSNFNKKPAEKTLLLNTIRLTIALSFRQACVTLPTPNL